MRQFDIESLSSSQVSRATRLLDEERQVWRNRPLGEARHLFLDARYEKVRIGGVVHDAAVLSAIGIGRMRGAGCWASRCPCPRPRSTGAPFSGEPAGARSARRGICRLRRSRRPACGAPGRAGRHQMAAPRSSSASGSAPGNSQFHLTRNAIHHAPNAAMRKRIGSELRPSGMPPTWSGWRPP